MHNFAQKILITISFVLIYCSLLSYNYFSPINKIERLYVSEDKLNFSLEYQTIFVNSEKVFNDSVIFLKNVDYQIDFQDGKISFFKPIGHVFIEYQIYPPELIKRFSLYQVQEYSDTTEIKLPTHRKQDMFSDTQLNIMGNKTISISVSNDEDFSLDQSLFLRINGKLSGNLRIEAQLSDSQSPITPEGDSREISSLDQIFIRLYGKKYEVSFGDLEMDFFSTRFMNYSPKFEGLKAGWFGKNTFQGALAIAKGKKSSIDFKGIEAKQGPYYITVNEYTGVQVVAGSEEVFLNGLRIHRGVDYTIDYAEGSITFTNKHFITSNSRILIHFQYTDEDYRQNLYLFSSSADVLENFQVKYQLILQNDDKDNPLLELFSEDDIEVLKAAGDETAWGSGVYKVGEGEEGLYNYVEQGDYYVYVGNDSTVIGEYNIYFTEVGQEQGLYDYIEDGNYYEYVGEGGEYLPVRKLPSSRNFANYNVQINYWGSFYNFVTEGIISILDKNTFSKLDDENNNGYAGHVELNLFPDWDNINPEIKFYYRNLRKDLTTFTDLDDPLESYEFIQLPDTLNKTVFFSEIGFDILNTFKPQIRYKFINAHDFAKQRNFSFISNLKQKLVFPEISYRYLNWNDDFDEDSNYDLSKSSLEQHDLQVKYTISKIYLGSDYFLKKYKNEYFTLNTLGEKLQEIKLTFGFLSKNKINAEIFAKQEQTDSLNISENWNRAQTSKTMGIKSFFNSKDHRGKVNYSHREIEGKNKDKFDIAEITLNSSFLKDAFSFNTNYSLKNIEFYPKVRELEYVGEELGIYDSLGFVSEDGEYDYIVTNIDYDNPEMSVEVNANITFFINPKMITDSFFKKFQTETYLLISDNSISPYKKQIYLLNPDYLMDEEYTLYGKTIFEQTLWFDFIPRKFILRLDFEKEKTIDQRYNDQIETRKLQTWELMLRLISIKNSNYELILEQNEEQESRYEVDNISRSIILEVQNKLQNNLILKTSLNFSNEHGSERGSQNDYKITSYGLIETITYFFKTKYRFFCRFSYKRNQRKGYDYTSYIDKIDGNIFKWNMNLNYKVSKIVYLNLEYSGNSYPLQDDTHQVRAEIKAEF